MVEKNAVEYRVGFDNANSHLFHVEMKLSNAHSNQHFSLPTWTPGSYMLREHAQHIVSIKAFSSDEEVAIDKITKNTFVVQNQSSSIILRYQVYGFDSSIRAAYIDNRQAFFNGTSLFLKPHGLEKSDYIVTLLAPSAEGQKNWQVATGMQKLDCDSRGFGSYIAKDYLALVDFPMQVSEFRSLNFSAAGIPHKIVLVDDVREFDEERLAKDLAKLCEQQIVFFKNKAPFENYLFIARFMENSHGGLEHRNSSMLLATPYSLPKKGEEQPSEHYRAFLGLCSHEYFHAWNVKSLKPKSFAPYDLNQECYTNMMWVFEGITSYYDDLLLKRAGVISQESYFELLSKSISRLLSNKGRHVQTLAQSSFDAWIKFYRPNENSHNATTSYYLKGSLVGLLADLIMRSDSQNTACLDDGMRIAMDKYGNDKGIAEEEFFACLAEAGLKEGESFKSKFIYGTAELPLAEMLGKFGIDLILKPDEKFIDDKTKMQAFLGLKLHLEGKQRAMVSLVESASPAAKAGLCAKDEIIAINNIRFDGENYSNILSGIRVGEKLQICYARNKRISTCILVTEKNPEYICSLKVKTNISNIEKSLLEGWLKGSF